VSPGAPFLATRADWIDALLGALVGWLPLAMLWAGGQLGAGALLSGALAGAVLALAAAWWRRRQRRSLQAAVEQLREQKGQAVPDIVLHEEALQGLHALERDIQALRRQVASADQLQRSLVDAVADPLLILDARAYVRMANPSAQQHFGQELVGNPIGRFLRDPGILAAIDSAIRADVSSTVNFTPLLDRTRRYTSRIHPIVTADGSPHAVLSLRETSEQVAIERMRSDFIANASHELRTPLTAIAGFVETLKGPARDDEAARMMFLDIMATESARMVRLIDDLLSLSRLEADAHRAPQDPVALDEVVAAALSGLEPQIEKGGMKLELAMPPDLPQVRGDADQLQQLVVNLVDNAIKYGRPGTPVRVEAELLSPAGDGAGPLAGRPAIRLSVIDQGEGIAAEHLPRLTERFYRADKSRSRRAGGTGLGLAICKHIVRRHGGHLAIESVPGQGSSFQVYLPV
jgi:two-component system phosphate regulon sensor histidine kinase PhoR